MRQVLRSVCTDPRYAKSDSGAPSDFEASRAGISGTCTTPRNRFQHNTPLQILLGLICICSLVAPVSSFAAPADDMKALVDQGHALQAYEFGASHPELQGIPAFDFQFGIAAINAGHLGEGILALERYLIQFPEDTGARIELARAYFMLGEDVRAREEFQNLLEANPPADARSTIERYLDTIRSRESRYKTTSSFYVEAGVGRDSNVNAGVSSDNVILPILGNVTVANTAVKKGDAFGNLTLGGQVSHPVSPGMAVFGGFSLDSKINHSEHAFDLLGGNLAGGVSALKKKDLYKLSIFRNTLSVENDRFRTIDGANGEWTRLLDEQQALQASVQIAKFSYTGANIARNADYTGLGLSYRRVLGYAWQPVLNLGLNYGAEANTQDRPDLGRNVSGMTLNMALSPSAKWGLTGGVSFLASHYRGPDAILEVTRDDKFVAFEASAVYLIDRNLSVRCEALLSDNRSNIALFSYSRNVVVFKVRYDFK